MTPTDQTPARLPPVGQIQNELDHVGAWGYMSQLALEDRGTRDPFIRIADLSVAVFNWGDADYDGQGFVPPVNIDALQVNQVQNDTIAVTKTTFREPTAFEIVCSDTGPYAPCYWAGPASIPQNAPVTDEMGQPMVDPMSGQPAMQQVDLITQLGLMPEHLGPTPEIDPLTMQPTGKMLRQQPIDEMLAMQLTQQVAALGLPESWVVHADKRLVSSIYQTYFDGVWSDPKFAGQQWAYRFGLDANTMGWNTAMYEWRQDKGDCIIPLSIKQCYFDNQHAFIKDMQHVMADFAFDVTWAKQQFPWIAEQIDQYKQKTGGMPVSIDGNTSWGQRDNRNFQRDIVIMRIGWFRDQPIPLTEKEALDGGHIQPVGGDQHQAVEASEPSAQAPPAYALPEGAPVAPGDPNWPMQTTLRRVMAIGGKIVSDMPEDNWDIPILHLVCFPITNTPYGTGIPFKCWQIQRTRSSAVMAIQEHGQYYAYPMAAGPTDVIESLGSDEKGRYVRPNATIKIDPKYLQNKHISDIFALINPPELPPSIVQAEELMEKIQTQLSGNVAVLRGEDLGSEASGKKVESLQDAAINQVNTGDETELCLQRLAMLMQHAHVKFATVDQVMRYYRKLPRSVLEAIHVDIAPTLNWEARVSVASGGGQLKTRKRQQAMIDLATIDAYTGKPVIDLQTAREEADIDHEEVEDRLAAQQLERAAMEAQQPQDEKKKEKEPVNA